MQIQIKKLIRPLDLAGYASEMQGQAVQVWVNPTREVIQKRVALDDELAQRLKDSTTAETSAALLEWTKATYEPGMREWFAQVWSQHENRETHWTADELAQLDTIEPALVLWLNARTMQMIREHRATEKKS